MKNLGKIHYFFGIAMEYDEQKSCLCKGEHFWRGTVYGVSEAKPSTTPADILQYLICIAHAVGAEAHLITVK